MGINKCKTSDQACLAGMPDEILLSILSDLVHLNAPIKVKPLCSESPQHSIAIVLVSKRLRALAIEVLYKESCFAIEAIPPSPLGQHQRGCPQPHYLESRVFKAGREKIQHVEINNGECRLWLVKESFESYRSQYTEDCGSNLSNLMSSLRKNVSRLVRVDFAAENIHQHDVLMATSIAVRFLKQHLPNVKEFSIVSRNEPSLRTGPPHSIERVVLESFSRNEDNGNWKMITGVLEESEEKADGDRGSAITP